MKFDWAVVGISVSVVMAAAGLMVGMIINCINWLDAEFADRIEHQDIQQCIHRQLRERGAGVQRSTSPAVVGKKHV